MAIIIDFHHYEEMMWDPWSHKERFLGIWRQVAEHYQKYPSSVLFELLNEPNHQLNASLWNQYLHEALVVVRETNPTRDVVIGPANWNAYDWVSTLDVPDDEHLIVTFHYYLPFEFTHQGAEWVGNEAQGWLGTFWEASDSEKAMIDAHFDSSLNGQIVGTFVSCWVSSARTSRQTWLHASVGRRSCAAKRNAMVLLGRIGSLRLGLESMTRKRRPGEKTC